MTTTTQNNVAVAETILDQLGSARRLAIMAGAKNFVSMENGVTFKIGRNDKGVTHFTVTLDANDTYTVRLQRVWGTKVTEKGLFENIYCDQLVSIFESETGMYLSL